jgi:hypothetical protein
MKTQIHVLALLVAVAAFTACKTKKSDEPEPVRTAELVEEEGEAEGGEPTEAAEEGAGEEEYDMVVSLEDLDKAVEAYAILHEEDLSMDEKRAKFEKFLEENEWAVDAYADLMYDIAQHSTTRAFFIKKVSN